MQRGDTLALGLAILLHVLVIAIVVFKWQVEKSPEPVAIKASLVQAKDLVSESQQVTELETIKPQPQQQVTEPPPKEKAKEQKPAEAQKSVAAQRAQQQREKRQAEQQAALKKKQQDIKKAQQEAKENERKVQQEALKKKTEQQKKQQAEKQKQEAEKKKQQALADKKALQKKRAAEAAAKKKAQQEKREEDALAQSIAREQAGQNQRLVGLYIKIIQAKVKKNWSRPPSSSNGLSVKLAISLSKNGEVLSVTKVTSSGDNAFDTSAINAVRKAARFDEITELPAAVFEQNFKNFNLRFKPE